MENCSKLGTKYRHFRKAIEQTPVIVADKSWFLNTLLSSSTFANEKMDDIPTDVDIKSLGDYLDTFIIIAETMYTKDY